MGMNWHKSYFATSYHDDTANQLYQYTFKGSMGTNQHELYTRLIFTHYIFTFRDCNHSHEGGSESAISNQGDTIIVSNKRFQ